MKFKFFCRVCQQYFRTGQLRTEHETNVHGNELIGELDKYREALNNIGSMLNDYCKTENISIFVCKYCNETLNPRFLAVHYRNHSTPEFMNGQNYECPLPDCSEQFQNLESVRTHVKSAHLLEAIKCHICNEMITDKQAQRQHEISGHPRQRTEHELLDLAEVADRTAGSETYCDVCDKFVIRKLSTFHVSAFHKDKAAKGNEKCKCPAKDCEMTYGMKSKNILSEHIWADHLGDRRHVFSLDKEKFRYLLQIKKKIFIQILRYVIEVFPIILY
jgi:hypothetical protein